MKKPRLLVTDHAIVRYLERVGGFDIDGLRHQIARRCESGASVGASSVIVEGFAFLIGDGQVITVVHAETMKKRRIRRRGE
jgi:hypothetical protein